MPISYVQSNIGAFTGITDGNSDRTLAYTSSNTAGNLIVVIVSAEIQPGGSSEIVGGVSDSNGNMYHLITSQATPSSSVVYAYYAMNCGGGANTVTLSWSWNGFDIDKATAVILEYSGLDISAAFLTSHTGQGTSTSPSSGSISPSGSSILYIGFVSIAASSVGSFTAGGSFTSRQTRLSNSGGIPMQVTDLISSGSQTATWTTDITGQWGAGIISFTSPLSAPRNYSMLIMF